MKQFKPGDRVRCYSYNGSEVGTIVKINEGTKGKYPVLDNANCYHEKQCRKLKPRAPKEAKEPIVLWADRANAELAGRLKLGEGTLSVSCCGVDFRPLPTVRLQEIPADAIPLTSQQLASAWVRAYGETCMCDDFRALAKALGFFAEAGGGESPAKPSGEGVE